MLLVAGWGSPGTSAVLKKAGQWGLCQGWESLHNVASACKVRSNACPRVLLPGTASVASLQIREVRWAELRRGAGSMSLTLQLQCLKMCK